MTHDKIILWYENSTGNCRVIRIWNPLSDSVVRETDIELMYNYPNEQWEQVHSFTRDYEIDNENRLVGDGSNWDGDGRIWTSWATERHTERLKLRFPYDFDQIENTPTVEEIAKEQIKANY